MTTQQLQKMRRGKQRATERHRREAIRRVKDYRAWLRAGCPSGPNVPALPSSNDFKIARGSR